MERFFISKVNPSFAVIWEKAQKERFVILERDDNGYYRPPNSDGQDKREEKILILLNLQIMIGLKF